MTSSSPGKPIIVAIDFGTSSTGYAYAFRDDFNGSQLRITIPDWTADGMYISTGKAPTTLLLDPMGKFRYFGYEAEEKYHEMAEKRQHWGWFYFNKFKMALDVELISLRQKIHRDTLIEDVEGKAMPARYVFSHVIRHLNNLLMRQLRHKNLSFSEKDIQCVITVPAIWSDSAKQFMREAAEEAGISKEDLLLSLEPEAASLYIRHLPANMLVGNDGPVKGLFGENMKYMILDLGGGTADITVHQTVDSEGRVKEIHKVTGGAWGGGKVDEAFLQFLCKLFGDDVIQRFALENVCGYLDLVRSFEVKKRKLEISSIGDIRLDLDQEFEDILKEKTGVGINKTIKQTVFAARARFKCGKLYLDSEVVKSFYKHIVNQIICHLKEILQCDTLTDLRTIFLIGGFSESRYVVQKIREALPDKHIVLPSDTGLAVLKGAVIFGRNPDKITERILKYSYGIAVEDEFHENLHPEEKAIYKDGRKFCKDVFHIFVKAGEHVKNGEMFKLSFRNTFRDRKRKKNKWTVRVFASTDVFPIFVTESHCKLIGLIEVLPPPGGWADEVEGEIQMFVGGTEFLVKFWDETNNRERKASFDFLA